MDIDIRDQSRTTIRSFAMQPRLARRFLSQIVKGLYEPVPALFQVLRLFALGSLTTVLAMLPLAAQVKSAGIQGSVTDPSGSVIPDAKLAVTEQATKETVRAVTSHSGDFTVPYLSAGTYTVQVQSPGFKSFTVKNIVLTVGQQYELNVRLSIGQVSENVTVASDAAQLQTESTTVQGTIGARVIESIPNTNQNPLYYATLEAGVAGRSELSQTTTSQSFGIGYDGRRDFSAINMTGGTAFSNDIQLDGLSILGSGWHEATVLPNTDALQEVRVITNNYGADLGRGQGVIQMATKSGTNSYHGSVYYRNRNEAFNANTFSNDYQGIAKTAFKVNDFGGAIGLPILHNKLFLFTSYEELLHHDQPEWLLTVPTAAERTGDFSATEIAGLNGSPTPVTIYNPFTAAPAYSSTGARIPYVYERSPYPNAIVTNPSAQALAIMNYYPLPNRGASDVYQDSNYYVTKTRTFERSSSNSRLDYRPNQRNSIYVSGGVEIGSIHTPSPYGAGSPFFIPPTSTPSGTGSATEPELVTDNNPYISLGDTIVLNSSTFLDIRYGMERVHTDYLSNSANLTAADYATIGVPTNVQSLMPLFGAAPDISPGGNFSALSNTEYNNKRERQTNSQLTGSISKTIGRWTLREGAEYDVDLSYFTDFTEAATEYKYQGTPTAQYVYDTGTVASAEDVLPQQDGFGGANVLTGEGGWTTPNGNAARLALAQKYFALYSENDWHPTNRLTLNFGLRWEVQPGPTERFNRSASMDLTKTNFLGLPGEIIFPGNNGLPRNLWQTTWNDYQPRLGVSFRPRNDLVIRGGYGISYQPNNTGWFDGPYNYGTDALLTSTVADEFGTSPDGVPVGTFYDPQSTEIVPAAGINSAAPSLYGTGLGYFDYHGMQPPRVQQWNVFLEQQLTPAWLMSIGYVASRGDHLEALTPIQNDQSIPTSVTQAWRQTYISTAAAGAPDNPGTETVPNPLQPTSGSLLPFQGVLGDRTVTKNLTYYPYLSLYPDGMNLDNGVSNYNSLVARLQHSYAAGLFVEINYVWSKSTDTVYSALQDSQGFSDSGNGEGPSEELDLNNNAANKKISYADIPQRFVGVATYTLPFGKTGPFALNNKLGRAFLGDWKIGTVVTLQDGFPEPPTDGLYTGSCSGAMNCRPNRTGEPFVLPKSYQRWYNGSTTITLPDGRSFTPCFQCFLKFNPDAFSGNVDVLPSGKAVPDIYWNGNAAIDYGGLRGPGRENVDLSLGRAFPLGEKMTFTFSANASNAFNHPQFYPTSYNNALGGINSVAEDGVALGEPLSNNYGTHNLTTYDPRQIVMEGRITF